MKLKITNLINDNEPSVRDGYSRGIVSASKDSITVGWVQLSPRNVFLTTKLRIPGLFNFVDLSFVFCKDFDSLKDAIIFDNSIGMYRFAFEITPSAKFAAKNVFGMGAYPYRISREYEAFNNLKTFDDSHVVEQTKDYVLGHIMDYTFGVEFETSCGYIPSDRTFIDGLIPLRDGSISGIEYSTIVLKGNAGLNSLKQCMDDLKKYTMFNKECALHIHMGGFPVDTKYIAALACVQNKLEGSMYNGAIPDWSFNTELYKANGKSYCEKIPQYYSFDDMFEIITGNRFSGSLTNPHPRDPERTAKWNIRARYRAMNLVNMVCYKNPKTVEFRFLRPTDNFKKVYLWLAILNAELNFAKKLVNIYETEVPEDPSGSLIMDFANGLSFDTTTVLANTYDGDFLKWVLSEFNQMRSICDIQRKSGDKYGSLTAIENRILGEEVL